MFNSQISRRKSNISWSRFLAPEALIISFGVLCLILLSSQMFLANRLSTDGEKIRQAELGIRKLEEENTFLENQLVSLGSLQKITQRAKELGMVKTDKVEIITPIPYAFVP